MASVGRGSSSRRMSMHPKGMDTPLLRAFCWATRSMSSERSEAASLMPARANGIDMEPVPQPHSNAARGRHPASASRRR